VASQSSSSSYFSLLGLPERYDLDGAALERAYLERSKETHPDRFATAPSGERLANNEKNGYREIAIWKEGVTL